MNISVIVCGVILIIWIAGYCFITKNTYTKHKIKLWLKIHFNDTNEKKWSLLVSLYYSLFPCLCLFFIPISQILDISALSTTMAGAVTVGALGFLASMSISCILLDWGVAIKNIDYREMNDVKWIKQVKKIGVAYGVAAALAEEYFQRYLIPALLYLQYGSRSLFVASLCVTSLIFSVMQVAYASTPIQRFVKVTAGISISVVSISLILATDSIVPSLISHSLYVFFFLKKNKKSTEE